jgi:hypothetical protein
MEESVKARIQTKFLTQIKLKVISLVVNRRRRNLVREACIYGIRRTYSFAGQNHVALIEEEATTQPNRDGSNCTVIFRSNLLGIVSNETIFGLPLLD